MGYMVILTTTSLAGAQGSGVNSVYTDEPSQEFRMMGYFATGVVSFDIDKDGWNDIIVSNGNDMSPQALTAYKNPGTTPPTFSDWPTWYSQDQAFRGILTAGDINQDGWVDVVVSVPFNQQRQMNKGGLRVYFNRNGQLESTPSYESADGYMSLGNTLADVDGDGDLDLIAAVFADVDAIFPPETPIGLSGQARIYLNQNGVLDTEPAWKSQEAIQSADVIAADLNEDGLLDLAFAAQHTMVYYGYLDEKGNPWIHNKVGWRSENTHGFSYGIDTGVFGKDDAISLAVSSGCISTQLCSLPSESTKHETYPPSYFYLYQPQKSSTPTWTSKQAINASKLKVGDVNNDGYSDLTTSQWGPGYKVGGPIWIFQGNRSGLGDTPKYTSKSRSVGQTIALTNLQKKSISRHHTHSPKEDIFVFRLPAEIVNDVISVSVDGTPLNAEDFTFVPSENWISIKGGVKSNQEIKVEYTIPPELDMILANWNPNLGLYIYFSFVNALSSR